VTGDLEWLTKRKAELESELNDVERRIQHLAPRWEFLTTSGGKTEETFVYWLQDQGNDALTTVLDCVKRVIAEREAR